MQIFDDVVFVVPDDNPVHDRLTRHAQQRGAAFWSAYHRLASAGNATTCGLARE
jgi:hypothetical protein